MLDFSINSAIDKRNIINNDNSIYDELIDILLKFIKDELKIKSKILCMDGTNLSLSKKLVKNKYAYQSKSKIIDRNKIQQIQNEYKEIIEQNINEYNIKIKNTKKLFEKNIKQYK